MTRIIVLALGLMLLGLSAVALWVTASPAPENELQRQPKLLGRFAPSEIWKRIQWA
jgi:hypothetical protein